MACKDSFDYVRLNKMSLKLKKKRLFWAYEQSYPVINEKTKMNFASDFVIENFRSRKQWNKTYKALRNKSLCKDVLQI